MPMPAIATKIAEKLGLAPTQKPDDVDELRPVPNRGEQRARGVRRSSVRPLRRRLRPAPHPLGQASMLRPAEHAKRVQMVEGLNAAYKRARDTHTTWVTPAEEQAWRDRRAARRRQRAARKASRTR